MDRKAANLILYFSNRHLHWVDMFLMLKEMLHKLSKTPLCRAYFLALGLTLLLAAQARAQEPKTMFVTDKLQVTVRTGSSVENKIIHVLNSGDQVSVLQTTPAGWALVRVPDGKEGWMIARYLQDEKPAILRLKELDPKAKDLVQRLDTLNERNKQLSQKLARAEAKAKQLENQFLKLKENAAGVEGVRGEYQKMKQELAKRSENLDELSAELESMRFGSNLKWFLAGAAVLIAGWLMGLAFGRRKRRWSSSLY